MEIQITGQEQAANRLSDAHLAQAVQAVETDGYVVLAGAVDPSHLDVLRARMDADSQVLIDAEKWGGAGQIPGHLQQAPPPFAPFVFTDVVANPFAVQVTHALLGDGLYNRFYSGNCNCPGSGTQPLHADGPHLFPQMSEPHPPVTLVVNICLVAVTEENGATELWPGTHRLVSEQRRIDPETEARRRETAPPVRACTPKGGLLIRDIRLWHRGTPNRSNHVRHMLALVHQAGWLRPPGPLLFAEDCRGAFPADSPLDHNATFTDQPIDYLFERYAKVRDAG